MWMKYSTKGKFDDSESYLDEALGFGLAALGFTWQFYTGFTILFPLNLLFIPVDILEWTIRMTMADPTVAAS